MTNPLSCGKCAIERIHEKKEESRKEREMKNHTNHNQNRKAHRNGIKRPIRKRHESTLGMDVKFLINQRYARRGNLPGPEAKKRHEERMAAHAGKPKPIKL